MKIDFTKLTAPRDVLHIGSWACIEESNIAPKLPSDSNREPEICRLYETKTSNVDFRFAPGFHLKMNTDRVQAQLFPQHLNSLEVFGSECSLKDAFEFAQPIVKDWNLICSELIGETPETTDVKYTNGLDELKAWRNRPSRSPETVSFLAETLSSPLPGIRFLRLAIFPSGSSFSARITSYWER